MRVSRAGQPVAGLDPYLGAYGHLVIIRAADLAYLHIHPDPQATGASATFRPTIAGHGLHRAFFDFSVGGAVHTAQFILLVG
jgi:hypothetical protein